MKRWRWVGVVALLLAAAAAAYLLSQRPDPSKMHVFAGVRGPAGVTKIVEPQPTRIAEFDRGSDHRLAILVTDPDSGWLGLVRGFRAHGVPITVTQDPAKALRHKVVLVYPIISGRVLQADAIRGLAEHVRSGGTVLAFNLAGGGLGELFGIGEGVERQTRTRLRWTGPAAFPEEAESVVSSNGETQVASVGYAPGTARVLATFEDGSVAASCRTVVGQACLLGIDLGALAQRAMNGRAETFGRRYVNGYEPSLDVLFRWVRDLYVAGEPMPWLVQPAPAGKQVSILLTHDVDYGRSVDNSLAYAKALTDRGMKGTFFIQTKYLKDYNDEVFFDDRTVPLIAGLARRGMDVGSHTVAHSRMFEHMELGTGRERYPRYRPFVQTDTTYRDATVLGELRVSKFLLEDRAGAKVVSFRPGRLSYPFSLPQAMAATGYRYSSSITANSVLTHLPYQLTDGRADGALQPIYEFPVTIEDEEGRLGDRFDAADQLVAKIARNGGLVTFLNHPNITDHKLDFETRLVDSWKDRAWIGSLADFGDWWAGRDSLETDLVQENGRWVLRAAAGRAARGVAVRLPKADRDLRLDLPAGGEAVVPVG